MGVYRPTLNHSGYFSGGIHCWSAPQGMGSPRYSPPLTWRDLPDCGCSDRRLLGGKKCGCNFSNCLPGAGVNLAPNLCPRWRATIPFSPNIWLSFRICPWGMAVWLDGLSIATKARNNRDKLLVWSSNDPHHRH